MNYSWFVDTLGGLSSTWTYLNQIVGWIEPTIDFMYDNVLTNPFFIVFILVILVLSLFTFGD